MLHTIGRSVRDESVCGLLRACHTRIRFFLDTAIAVQSSSASDAAIVDACNDVERYFGLAFPLHLQDEEESILPRILGRSPRLDEALRRMTSDHVAHAAPLAALLELAVKVRESANDQVKRDGLASAASALRVELERHLREEEAIIFPGIELSLSNDVQAQIVEEMRARRRPPAP
ncbi:MAG: hemerythrin domain-containing protein [Polyangiaceae bacterium]